jgi:hypothetical protein
MYRTEALLLNFSTNPTQLTINYEIFHTLISINYLSSTQKGFLPSVSGCIEHLALLRHATEKIQSTTGGKAEMILVMTDLSNAFGTVRHSLIDFILNYYHFPHYLVNIINEMYKNLTIRFTVKNETDSVNFQIGVFQGDVASPILFLCVINLFTDYLKKV